MAPQTPQQGESGTESSRTLGTSSNMPPAETQLQRKHHLAHCDTANAGTANTNLDAQYIIVCKMGSSEMKMQRTIGCEYSRIVVYGSQLIIYPAAGVHGELRDQFIATRNGKPPWSTKAFVRTVCGIKHSDAFGSGISAYEFRDRNPREGTKQALTLLEDATEVYMVEVLAESDMLMQQLISCRFSTCLQLWQGKEVGYS